MRTTDDDTAEQTAESDATGGDARHELATFDDRWALRYVRVFRAPIERVWRAVTTEEELNIWFLPVTRIDARLGGRVSFTWGAPEHAPAIGSISIFEPPSRIRFQAGRISNAYLDFELEALDSGSTRLTLVHRFPPGRRHDQTGIDPSRKDADLPGGPDTPWRPGFVAGFHVTLEELGAFIARNWSRERIERESQWNVDVAKGQVEAPRLPDNRRWRELVELYWEHIRRTCPEDHRTDEPRGGSDAKQDAR